MSVQEFLTLRLIVSLLNAFRCRKIQFDRFRVLGTSGKQFRKKTPSGAIPRKMVQTQIPGDGLEPAARGRIVLELVEALECFQENFLRHVLRFGLVGEQTHGRAKYHVLVVPHEHLELLGICHRLTAALQGLSYL